jgi:hypothetical protein
MNRRMAQVEESVWPEFAVGGHILGNFGGGVAGK